jgi:uncharacterized protein YecT (DUF1311 family)
MPTFSDGEISILRRVAERIGDCAQQSTQTRTPGPTIVAANFTDLVAQPLPIDFPTLGADARFDAEAQSAALPTPISFATGPSDGGGLLKRDRVRRLAWRTAAAGILLGITALGTYALMSGRIVWPRMIGAITKSDPAVATRSAMSNTSNGFAIVRAVTAATVAADGQPQNVAASFDGRTPLAVLFDTQGGKPGKDVITTSVSGMNFEQPCEPMVVTHPDATYWCQWEALGPGDYKITIQLNGAVVHELSFAIADLSKPRQEPAIGRDIQSSFECLRAAASVDKTICENETLARLQARMETLYRTARGQSDQAGQSRIEQQQGAFASARKIKCSQAALPEAIACIVSMTEQRIQELDANQLPSFPASTAFADVRRHLTALGWRPVTLATARPCPPGDASCSSDLEMVVCSGGLPATCRHTWMRDGKIIEITTLSGEKSEVESVVCRAGC